MTEAIAARSYDKTNYQLINSAALLRIGKNAGGVLACRTRTGVGTVNEFKLRLALAVRASSAGDMLISMPRTAYAVFGKVKLVQDELERMPSYKGCACIENGDVREMLPGGLCLSALTEDDQPSFKSEQDELEGQVCYEKSLVRSSLGFLCLECRD